MGQYRQSNLLAAESITTAGTKVIDINLKDIISRINIIVRLTNSSWTPTGHPNCSIIQVDLVDGSKPIHSMRGRFSQALAFYGTKQMPFNYVNYTDNGLAVAVIPIYFGRKLWDEELALDPKMFNNLQLKIQHNYLLGGAVPDGATLEVWADIFDEKVVNPVGYLSATSEWSKTLVASTNDYIDLPTDAPIRFILPAAFSNDEEVDINIDAVKISEDHDKHILYDSGVLELLQMYENLWPVYVDHFEGRTLANTDIEFFFTQCKDLVPLVHPSQDSDGYINVIWSGGNGMKINENATVTIFGEARGRCPNGVFPLPFGDPDIINTWLQAQTLGSLEAKLTTGAGDTSALYELLVQRMLSY